MFGGMAVGVGGLHQGEVALKRRKLGWTGGRGSQIETNETKPRTDETRKGLRAIGTLSRFLNWGVTQHKEV